uniref:Bidirectional sugar transporter SWEET n=1 Tax=Chenopodium quinoa TaxID=63459 RepID=A0A803MET8_CHEQI
MGLTFVGIFCDIFGIILYGAPLTVMISNGVGAILAVAQLILYACYYGSTPKEGKPVKDPVKPTAPQVHMTVSAV